MILSKGIKKFPYVTGPGKGTAFPEVVFVRVIGKGFQLERIKPVSDVMALPVHPSYEVKKYIEDPVKNKHHLHLLPEMDLFMADELGLIMGLACDPDEDEK